jgi:hypothetical protein
MLLCSHLMQLENTWSVLTLWRSVTSLVEEQSSAAVDCPCVFRRRHQCDTARSMSSGSRHLQVCARATSARARVWSTGVGWLGARQCVAGEQFLNVTLQLPTQLINR